MIQKPKPHWRVLKARKVHKTYRLLDQINRRKQRDEPKIPKTAKGSDNESGNEIIPPKITRFIKLKTKFVPPRFKPKEQRELE